jgi:hypothetical protein
MRLTVRTLLAWLDGLLPSEEHTQLGEKVSASHMASMLAERIRVAVTRPAIAAPAPNARGLADDANSAAEFLDNTLSVDQIEAFERICIDSDMHLAEVAACHAMLAEIVRNPEVSLTAECVERLKKLVRDRLVREPIDHGAGRRSPPEFDGPHESRETARAWRAALGTADDPEPHDTVLIDAPTGTDARVDTADGRPSGRARGPSRAAWWSAAVALTLLLTLVGVLGWSIFKGLKVGGRRPAAVEVAVNAVERPDAQDAPPAATPADAAATDLTEAAAPQPPAGDDAIADGDPPPAMRTADDDAPAPVAAADAAAPPTAVAASTRGPTSADASPRTEPSAPASRDAPVRPGGVDARPAPEPVDGECVVGSGTLLRLVKGEGAAEWRYAAPETTVQVGEELLVPPWSEATITVRGVKVRLLAQTSAVLQVGRDGTPRADVLYGRAVIGGGADSRLGITTGGIAGVIVADATARVAVEAGADGAGAGDANAALAAARGFITAGQRPFLWQPVAPDGSVLPDSRPLQIAAGSAVAWGDGRAGVLTGVSQPAWLEAEGFTDGIYPERFSKSASGALAAKLAEDRPLLLSLKELAEDRSRVENRMIAAATLALVGDSDELVELLAADSSNRKNLTEQMWLTLERLAVPAALARGGEAAAGLHQSFIDRGPEDRGERLWAMARGFSDAELEAGADGILVESLEDPHLIVRRYAFKTLCDIAQPNDVDRLRYRPDGLADLRGKGVAWWKDQLTRGLIRRRAAPPVQ